MPVRIVQSKQNARLKQLRRALEKPARGLAAIEGPNLVDEALRANLRIATLFSGVSMRQRLRQMSFPPETEVLVIPDEILASMLTTETPQPLAALVEPRQWTWEHVLVPRRTSAPLILVLAGLQDPGNLGTILRSAEAFAATGVVSLPGTVSAWNPKAVRASAGSIFRLPIIDAGTDECIRRLHDNNITVWSTLPTRAKQVDQVDLVRPVAIVIGNEGHGVPDDVAARADAALTIPCPGPVDSLNAAVAAGILLYEAARQRFIQPRYLRKSRTPR